MQKVIVITGASSGIGKALALHFAEQGHPVCAVARNSDKLEELRGRFPEKIRCFAADVSDRHQISDAFSGIRAAFERIDVLINSAGVFQRVEFANQPLEDVERIIDTNLKGALYCTSQALAFMSTPGWVVNISSTAGTHGIAGSAAYCASKFGLVGFGDALAQELLPRGVLVVTLCPGSVNTPIWNERNPYPRDLEKTMDVGQVVRVVDFVLDQPPGTLFKKVIFFPSIEWH